ncbi:MAG: ferritin-like domain-containing protein [Pirellulaceae bacterium]|nr:ferritin-like domain-containing protein [Pirellulaceae bacterium]
MSSQAIINKLNEALRHEWTGLAQYAQFSFVVSGLMREVYEDFFKDNSKECFDHARKVGDKIVALGGTPAVDRNNVQQTKDLQEMLELSCQFEKDAVKVYQEALELAKGDYPLTIFLEDLLLEEQEGVEEIQKILGGECCTSASSCGTTQAG